MAKYPFQADKERLVSTLTRFDNSVTVEDVTDSIRKGKPHPFLVPVLLETICGVFEHDTKYRQLLFEEVRRRLSQSNVLNESVLLDSETFIPLRRNTAEKFFEFVREIHSEVVPNASQNTVSVDSVLNGGDFSTNLQLDNKYEKTFEELEVIAKGGFGTVCKARHKVDGNIYAVKKIIFKYKSDPEYNRMIREAKSIATLNHPNVVSYNNAWVEWLPPSNSAQEQESSSESVSSDSSEGSDSASEENLDVLNSVLGCGNFNSNFKNNVNEAYIKKGLSSTDPEFHVNNPQLVIDEAYSSHEDSFIQFISESKENSYNLNEDPVQQLQQSQSSFEMTVKVMLCIQMEYCDCDLGFWLDCRAVGQELPFQKDVIDIFKDILNGVAHIHSKSIIHRDLKPQNIFFSKKSNSMKIGDFGLATLAECSSEEISGVSRTKYSANLGTAPYAAPEQLKRSRYNSKVDIYSLGIILIELLLVLKTKMGHQRVIEEVLKGEIPSEMSKKWPGLSELVQNMVQTKPERRMSATEILEHSVFLEQKGKKDRQLKDTLIKKDEEIEQLKVKVEEKAEEIEQLKVKVEEKAEEIEQLKVKVEEKAEEIDQLKAKVKELEIEITRLKFLN